MARIAELADGTRLEFPDDASDEVIQRTVRSVIQGQAAPRSAPTRDQRITASMPMRVARGVTDALDAGAQYLPWALGAVSGGFGMAPNRVSDFLFSESDRVSRGITEREKAYQDARRAVSGDVGFDSARFAGNVVSPVNAALAAAGGAALPASRVAQAGVGAALGGMGALTAPVVGADSESLGRQKAAQAAVGAGAGAVLTPAASKLADVLGPALDRVVNTARKWTGRSAVVPETVVYNSVRSELSREGISLDDIPETILRSVTQQVRDAMKSGQKIDAAALVRQADFEALGTRGTLGQITRDPVQYTREMNLRGVAGAGDPLARRFAEQRQSFGEVFRNLGADKADDAYTASGRLADSLAEFDSPRALNVDRLYQSARDSAGRSAAMNTEQFSRRANDLLDEQMLGSALPEGARNLLNRVSKGEVPLTVNTAVQIRRRLEGQARDLTQQGNREGALAIRQVIGALDDTDVESRAGADALVAFDRARAAARERFSTIDRNPALKAFLEGDVNSDTFVSKYVINGKTDDLKELSQVLNDQGKQTVRQQLAAHLEKKAFGSNVSGDSAFAIERYNEELKRLGRERLKQFFSSEEIDRLYTVGRAAAWAGKRPAGSAVNESNTAAAAMNLFSQLRGATIALPVVRQVGDSMVVTRGLLAQPPAETIPVLTPALRRLVPGVPVAAGVGSAGLLTAQ
jgi:hypothetical protein